MLEVVFQIIKETSNIESFEIFQKKCIYTAYANDATFFLKNTESVINLLEIFKDFSQFSGLKPNKSKCEIAGIGVPKGAKVAFCGMRCVNLHEDTIKILGTHYSYNKQLENDENFKKYIAEIENVLKLWKARNLSLEGKITLFKSLALSKITHLALVKTKHRKFFIWNGLNPKIRNSTINNNYEDGGLKNVNIDAKISSLQSSWMKRLFDENFHNWKILPLHIIHKSLGKKFVFHSNLKVNKKLTKSFPKYYGEIINTWGSKFSCQTLVPSAILSQFLWFTTQVQISNKSVFFSSFSERNINFVGQLLKAAGTVKSWKQLQEEYGLANKLNFK